MTKRKDLMVEERYTSRGVKYVAKLKHEGLHKYQEISGTDLHAVEQKAQAKLLEWEEMWEKKQKREKAAQDKEAKKQLAATLTEQAQDALSAIEETLSLALERDATVDWEALKDFSEFSEPQPSELPPVPIPQEPQASDAKYQARWDILDRLFTSRKQRKIQRIREEFNRDYGNWQKSVQVAGQTNRTNRQRFQEALHTWQLERQKHIEQQKVLNQVVDAKRDEYFNCAPDAVRDYCDTVLTNSPYPESFPREYDLDYIPDTKVLIVEYFLPLIEAIPTLKEVNYVVSSDELRESHLSASALNKMYDDLLYKMALRSLHELYQADAVHALDAIVFNGWVRSIDKATGQEVTACILSVQAGRDEFLSINLAQVDAKVCFKKLKGVGSSKLHGLSPIAPIMKIDRKDTRFVSSYAVADSLDESENLAAMDWEDFEHLIRELFEKEFSQSGGEVKVTQASRDGGVDAVVFDPDPIRGGKIVIQAKRYTNVVGVAAVRDLYGTLVNEGATKGILVTTANYGPDAYEFAKGKPITLLNGSNLLHLLEKHGHKAKIDLKEAKSILAEQEK